MPPMNESVRTIETTNTNSPIGYVRVNLNYNYMQEFEPKYSRTGTVYAVDLSDSDELYIRNVDPQAAPIAYCVTSRRRIDPDCSSSFNRFVIRSFDGGLWWPLSDDDGVITASTFLELAQAGHTGARRAFDERSWKANLERSSPEVFFAKRPARKLLDSTKEREWTRVMRGAQGVIICDNVVYLNAGEPVWFAETTFSNRRRLNLNIGCSSAERDGSYKLEIPGVDLASRIYCASKARAFGLDEFELATAELRRSRNAVNIESAIETLIKSDHAITAPLLCEQSLARDLWYAIRQKDPDYLSLAKLVPALAVAGDDRSTIDDLDCREVVFQLASLMETKKFSKQVLAARTIRRRLISCGVAYFSTDDDQALSSIGI